MLATIQSWWNQPYQENMTAVRWFLFVGLLMIIGIIWTVIIKHLSD
jgi:hypothetical protein